MIQITPSISIDAREIEERFIRASGPGGQNVNKVASAVQLRFNAAASPSLSDAVRQRLIRLAGRRMTAKGIIVIKARRFRSQDRNREDALSRLVALIRKAAQAPRPRRKTKPTKASRERRLDEKQRRGTVKRTRKPAADDD